MALMNSAVEIALLDNIALLSYSVTYDSPSFLSS